MFKKREIIYSVYKEGGFSKAAEALHISQPSLSVMVSKVEKELGEKLFDRSTTPVMPTYVGCKYLECYENISMIEEDFRNFLNDFNDLETGSFILGGSSLYMANVIPEILTLFSEKYPNISITLLDHESDDLRRLLISGDIDVVIDNWEEESIISPFDKYYLGTEFLFIAVPSGNPLNEELKESSYTYEDIISRKHIEVPRPYMNDLRPFMNQPFIQMQTKFDTRRRSDAVFEEHGIHIHSLYEFNQLSSTFAIAASGLGLTVVSDTLIKHSPNWGGKMNYYAVKHPKFQRDVFFYALKNRIMQRSVKALIDVTRQIMPLTLFQEQKTGSDEV